MQLNHLTDKQLHCAGLLLCRGRGLEEGKLWDSFNGYLRVNKFYARFEPRLSTTNNDIMEHNEPSVTMQTPTTHRVPGYLSIAGCPGSPGCPGCPGRAGRAGRAGEGGGGLHGVGRLVAVVTVSLWPLRPHGAAPHTALLHTTTTATS